MGDLTRSPEESVLRPNCGPPKTASLPLPGLTGCEDPSDQRLLCGLQDSRAWGSQLRVFFFLFFWFFGAVASFPSFRSGCRVEGPEGLGGLGFQV